VLTKCNVKIHESLNGQTLTWRKKRPLLGHISVSFGGRCHRSSITGILSPPQPLLLLLLLPLLPQPTKQAAAAAAAARKLWLTMGQRRRHESRPRRRRRRGRSGRPPPACEPHPFLIEIESDRPETENIRIFISFFKKKKNNAFLFIPNRNNYINRTVVLYTRIRAELTH